MFDTLATPRIYVASLTDYNNSLLHGRWIDVDQTPDDINQEIAEMLALSPTARKFGEKAEEFAIHDFDNFPGVELSEYESIDRVCAVAEILKEYPAAVVSHMLRENENLEMEEIASIIEDIYIGEFSDHLDEIHAVAEYMADDIESRGDLPEIYRQHIGAIAESMANDAIQGGEIHALYEGAGVWHLLRTY
ncbi:antirestriction protein ArdA [Streptomyces nanshensis]|uniref:Antirestriction protein n=1 Tax=Streptomyces nanshensis TaxID=518642 RepID=A0A1E7LAJ4_9ACTN|nr:antirestriction protein ArdA [Streptomyces nanshensis]OEV13216.1 hypothetical protein AN218_04705 [Streptomyces nanshensis]